MLWAISSYAQEAKLYLNDSTIYAIGLSENEQPIGSWKYYDSVSDSLLLEGDYQNGLKSG